MFRGYSLDAPSHGGWVALDGDVVVSKKDVKKARKLFMSIGKQLGQRAIFFDVRPGGEIIDLE